MKPKFTLFFLLFVMVGAAQAQIPITEYFFTDGSLDDHRNDTNALVQTGTSMTTVNDRDGYSNQAVGLNGDVLQSVSATKRSNYSVSFWMNTSTDDSMDRYIVDQYGSIGYRFRLQDGDLKIYGRYIYVNDQVRYSQGTNLTKTDIADGQWHHVVLTMQVSFNATLNGKQPKVFYRLYVDNVLVQTTDPIVGTIEYGTNEYRIIDATPVSIGSSQDMSADNYTDQIDDVRLYAKTLSAAEIETIYDQRTAPLKIYVNSSATGTNDGTSWTDAYTELVTATDSATAVGDQIWVAAGTYKPDVSNRTKAFVVNEGVSLYGGFSGTESTLDSRDWITNQTILSGDLSGNDDSDISYNNALRSDNSYRVVHVTGSGVTIDGVTVTSGQANNTNNNLYNRGGLLYKENYTTSITLRNSKFQNGVSNREGALFLPIGNDESTVEVMNCIISNNFGRYSAGIGMTNTSGGKVDAKIYNSLFFGNIAGDINNGDGFAGSSVGAFANEGTVNLEVINCTFTDNEDLGTTASIDKGTILLRRLNDNSTATVNAVFHNNIFHNNLTDGGAVNTQQVGLLNRASNLINQITATHNIINQDLSSKASSSTISDNIDQDPLFTDASTNDYTLQASSPAVDAGDNSNVPVTLLSDLARSNRTHNSTVDLGVYEYGSTPRNFVAPTAIAQDITVELEASGDVTITPSQINNGSSDDDTPTNDLQLSLDITSFSCDDIGTQTVELSVTDNSGNTSTATATVTIEDNMAPDAISQDFTAQLDADGNVSITATDLDNGSSDNCTAQEDLVLSLDLTSFTCSDLGTHSVTLTVEDESGNQSTSTSTVTVVDNTAPSVSAQNVALVLDASGNATLSTSQVSTGVSDNCTSSGDITLSLNKTSFTCSDIGNTTVTLTAEDASRNQGTATATITVSEQIAPTAVAQDITVQLGSNGLVSVDPEDVNNGSSDNCTSATDLIFTLNESSFDCADIGSHSVILTVEDESGNQSTATATVTVEDQSAPSLLFKGGAQISLDINGLATLSSSDVISSTTDNCTDGGDIIITLAKTSFDCSNLGSNSVNVTVEDASGNQESADATITVVDQIAPTINIQDATIQLNANGSATLTFQDLDNGSVDNCTAATDLITSLDKTSFTCSDIGSHTVTVTIEDASGNQSTATATVTVEDSITPTVITQDISVDLGDDGTATITADQIDNGSTDNCTSATDLILSLDISAFTTSHVGSNTVTLTVQDASGNKGTGSATVTVIEREEQVITFNALADKSYGDSDFSLSATSDSGLPVSYSILSGPASINNNTVTITGVGVVTIEASQPGDSEYKPATSVQQTFTINKAILTVTAVNQTITYGEPIPALAFTYSGFVYDESETVITNHPTISTNATATSDAGSYDIILAGGVADHYEFNLINGTLTINKANQTISIQSIDDQDIADANTVEVIASASSGLDLSLTISGPATISGTTVTLTGIGEVTITATQTGNINFNEAQEVSTSFNVTDSSDPCADFSLIIEATTGAVLGNDGTADITVTGGTLPYNFAWSDGTSNEDLSDANPGSYTITVTDFNGCILTENVTIGGVITGNSPLSEEFFNYFPNPTSDLLNLEISLNQLSEIQIQVLDLSGRVMLDRVHAKQQVQFNTQLDLTRLNNGQYILKLRVNDEFKTLRISKY